MHVEIAVRHGDLGPSQHAYLRQKTEKLVKYFSRLMSIEVAVTELKYSWQIEIVASAEHKHDFVAREEGPNPEAAMDGCVHKIEEQIRRYKEKIQNHRDEIPQGGTSPDRPELPDSPALS